MIALLLGLAHAAEPGDADAVVIALREEVQRAVTELALPEAEGPYFVGVRVLDAHRTRVQASLGGLVQQSHRPVRTLSVEVRVGSPQSDNSNFDAARDGFRSAQLVQGRDVAALRHDAWLTLDRAYKDAVEALAAKQAADRRRAQPIERADFAPGEPQQAWAEPVAPVDVEAVTELAREVSAVFLEAPEIEISRVTVEAVAGRWVIVDSLGTEVVEPADELVIRIGARARADDGASVVDQALFVGRASAGLPDASVVRAGALQLAQSLADWRGWPVATEEYVGPVVFEGAAAAELFRHTLVPAVQGTPPVEKPPRGSRVFLFDDASAPSAMRFRRRLLPPGWSVVDDPAWVPHSPSSYAHDGEGQPARFVELVIDGIVRDHLTTRTPSDHTNASNGHARGGSGHLLRAMPSNLRIRPDRRASDGRVHRKAIKLAASYGQDHYVRVRRLSDPSVRALDVGPIATVRSILGFSQPSLPDPVRAVRVFRDGREQPVRGWSLSGIDVRSLREIVAASGSERHAMMLSEPTGRGAGRVPVTIDAPTVLIPEAELAPATTDVERPPSIASPLTSE
ncbi:MAG: hypothetical protein KTR31_39870 [Myxococcales bacterium]|nr:hypothetical protein [Myxococcales bacterium]